MVTREKVLVTGGGGFLGRAIVKKLLKDKVIVKSFARNLYQQLSRLGVEQIQGDLSNKNDVVNACKGCTSVFHVAAKPGIWGTWQEYYSVNYIGTLNVIKACKKNKVSRLIHTSSPSVIFNGKDMEGVDETYPYPEKFEGYYSETKAMAEKIVLGCSSNTLKTIILRPHLIWGPGDNHLIPGIIKRSKRLKKIGRTDDLVDTIYIDNAADAHVLAWEKLKKNPGLSKSIYFISQDQPISKWEMADRFLQAAGLPPVKGYVSKKTAFWAGAVFEIFYRLFNIKKEPVMTRFAAKELATSHWFDISKAKNELGYVPKVSIEQGLEKLKEWYEKQNV